MADSKLLQWSDFKKSITLNRIFSLRAKEKARPLRCRSVEL